RLQPQRRDKEIPSDIVPQHSVGKKVVAKKGFDRHRRTDGSNQRFPFQTMAKTPKVLRIVCRKFADFAIKANFRDRTLVAGYRMDASIQELKPPAVKPNFRIRLWKKLGICRSNLFACYRRDARIPTAEKTSTKQPFREFTRPSKRLFLDLAQENHFIFF
ncbi:MAG: hypothetical protein IJR49_05725, partial [Treponema sp.]|nr:hypothetical protein [Treponema sp.]